MANVRKEQRFHGATGHTRRFWAGWFFGGFSLFLSNLNNYILKHGGDAKAKMKKTPASVWWANKQRQRSPGVRARKKKKGGGVNY